MTKSELITANIEFQKQAELDRINIHNRLNQDCRQPEETLNNYASRLAAAQFFNGFDEDDFIFLLPPFSKQDIERSIQFKLKK